MRAALDEARQAFERDEVPVGAVIRLQDAIIARAHDMREETGDPTAHAEIIAIRKAADRLGDWRLERCILYVTLEPCPMCAGAILLARMKSLVYGAPNLKMGAISTHTHLLDNEDFNHTVEVVPGILNTECAELLSSFFSRKR
jgi:tRNA(adenine34) deaminase